MAISLAIKNKFRGAVKELLMGGASVPTNAEMPGLAAVVMEAQLEQCANEIRPLADTEVDPAELVEAEKVVLEGMKEHQRLIKLSEDSRASKVLVDLEARIVEAQAKVEETQQGTAELLDELRLGMQTGL
ncbi:unnamed protein product [Effrenium voratum]|uniref:Uncharacterized protein n=1 Tax=Effrenium voratum TaxID=2562239 RepID=A0AA36I2F2_9DINO|nr:unnamed protein product [Effrenium voratum]